MLATFGVRLHRKGYDQRHIREVLGLATLLAAKALCEGDSVDLGRIVARVIWTLIRMLTRSPRVDTIVSTIGKSAMTATSTHISAWGNGLALRLTKPMARAAGVAEGTRVHVSVKPGRIVIETDAEPTLEQMLVAFDPKRHGGEAMADAPVGLEVIR